MVVIIIIIIIIIITMVIVIVLQTLQSQCFQLMFSPRNLIMSACLLVGPFA